MDYEVIALSRDASRAVTSVGNWAEVVEWDGRTSRGWIEHADGALAIINLAGENVAAGRWNKSKKAAILNSRLDSSRAVLEAISQVNKKPAVVIQASAVGYYGSRRDDQLDEASMPGEGFLASVCRRVESFAEEIEHLGVRCVVIRTGIVLGRDGGALAKLIKPFKLYVGGYLGDGRQWFSWISLEDKVSAIRFLMENENLKDVFNLTSPQPVTMKEFCMILGKVLHRPAWLGVPGFVVRFALGEMAKEMLLSGQRVQPKRLLAAGFIFKYPDVEKALNAIIS
jgi:uncharacterized protein (TIGR01777 family)